MDSRQAADSEEVSEADSEVSAEVPSEVEEPEEAGNLPHISYNPRGIERF